MKMNSTYKRLQTFLMLTGVFLILLISLGFDAMADATVGGYRLSITGNNNAGLPNASTGDCYFMITQQAYNNNEPYFKIYDSNENELNYSQYSLTGCEIGDSWQGLKSNVKLNDSKPTVIYVKLDPSGNSILVTSTPPSCGPTVGTLTAPDAVCDGETLTATPPTVSGATSQGWRISSTSSFPNAPSNPWTNGSAVTMSQNGYYLRYWASDGSTTNYSNAEQITVNPYITLNSLSTNNNIYCSGSTTLTANITNGACFANGYTKEYDWYNGSTKLATNNSNTYVIPSAGTYHVVVRVKDGSGDVVKEYTSGNVTISAPTNTVTASPTSRSLQNLYGAATAASGTVTASVSNTCNEATTYELLGADAGKFSVSKSGNTYTVTFNEKTAVGTYNNATLRIKSSADNTKYVDVPLTGTVPPPSMTVSTTALDEFQNDLGGTATQKTFTVTLVNAGTGYVTATSNSSDFEVVSVTNNGGGTYTVTVSFTNTSREEDGYEGVITVQANGLPIADQTVNVTGTVACNPPTIAFKKYSDINSITEETSCGCNNMWYAKIKPENQWNSAKFYITINGSRYIANGAPKPITPSGITYTFYGNTDNFFAKNGNTADSYYVILTNTGVGYTLTVQSEDEVPSCAPKVTAFAPSAVCKGSTFADIVFPTAPVVSSSSDIASEGWEYSETGSSGWAPVTNNLVLDKPYYLRYVATDVSDRTGPSDKVQVSFKDRPTITVSDPTEICAGGTFADLQLGTPTINDNGCTLLSDGKWQYSENNSSWSDVASSSMVMDKKYYIRYVRSNVNGLGQSNIVEVAFKAEPEVESISEPAIFCKGNSLSMVAPTYTLSGCGGTVTETWQYSTDGGRTYNNVSDLSTLQTDGTRLRYAVTDMNGTGYSNYVTLRVADVPSISIEQPEEICGGANLTFVAPEVSDAYYTNFSNQTWQISSNNSSYSALATNGSFTETTAGMNTTQNGYYVRFTARNTCGVGYSEPKQITVNEPGINLSGIDDVVYGIAGVPATLATAVAERVCTDENENITFSLTDNSGYFSINSSTGEITVNGSAVAGDYTLKVTTSTLDQGGNTVTKEKTFTVTLKNTPTLSLSCPTGPISGDICHTLSDIAYSVTSSNIVGKVSVALSGTASKYFTSASSLDEGADVALMVSQNTAKPIGEGDYTLTVTVSAKGADGVTLTETCNVTIRMTNVDTSIPLTLKTAGGSSEPTIYCAEELGLVTTVGNEIEVSRYTWYNGSVKVGKTSNNEYTMSFDCGASNYDSILTVEVMSKAGCTNTTSMTVHVKKYENVYYYCSGLVSDPTSWKTNANCSGTSPSNFSGNACQYIINKDAELTESEVWNVSGIGSKITVGDGTWLSMTKPASVDVSGATTDLGWGTGYGMYVSGGEIPDSDKRKFHNQVAAANFRNNAKTFKISGEANLASGVSIDVRSGSELEIATDLGNPTIGELEHDHLNKAHSGFNAAVLVNGVPSGKWSNLAIIPGSIVTYTGDGAKAVQAASYYNVFIDTDGDVIWEDGETEIYSQLTLLKTPSSTDLSGTTISYVGSVDQSIAPISYDNLEVQNVTTKKVIGDIKVDGRLTIGSGSTFDGGDGGYTLEITGCDNSSNVVDYRGHFNAGNSTVLYSGECNQIVAAMPYYNLSLENGNKTLSNENIIGVSGSFAPSSSYTYTVNGSTVEFNGTTSQTISAFTFDNLVINNSSFSSGGTVSMLGNVTVNKQLMMTDGVLTPGSYTLLVTNDNPSAVMNGHYTDATHQSFINGSLTRYLPAGEGGTGFSEQYIFPVGNMTDGYLPLTLSQITTESGSGQPMVTVNAIHGSRSLTGSASVTNLNTGYYWSVDGNSAYTQGKVSLATAANATLSSLGYNSVVYSNGSSTYEPLKGTALTSSMIRSNESGEGLYTLGTINITSKTYYYDCNAKGDITNIRSWYTAENGAGTQASSFNEDYATWIIKCDATFARDLSIEGANSTVIVDENATVTIESNVLFSSLHLNKASELINNNKLTVMEKFEIDKTGLAEGSSRSAVVAVLTNNGEMNVYAEKFYVEDAWVYNNANAVMNFNNTEMTIYNDVAYSSGNSFADGGSAGHFINAGKVNMVNSGLKVHGRFVQLKNKRGASWVIDNSSSAYERTILFEQTELYHGDNDYVSLECGSSFEVNNSDVRIEYVGNVESGEDNPVRLGGDIVVKDGNLSFHRCTNEGGGTVTIEHDCGGLYLYDTDKSGDGILTLYSNQSATKFNVEGTMFVMGFVQEGGKGAEMTIMPGGFAFIGDMGAVLPGYSWNYTINIEEEGVLHYCGNRTATEDNIGTNHGELYYAENFYLSEDPINQGDFTNLNPGVYKALYETLETCMQAYMGLSGDLLPIELTMLYGVCIDENTVELRWQTASETNNSYFVILRSFDGVHFEEIGTVAGAGTTTEMHNYEYYDTDEKEGVVYYKLRQTDFDGNTTESKVIAVQTCGKNAHFKIKQDEIEVFFRNPQANYVVITSVTGQIFYSKKFTNVEEARIAVPQRKGIYIISVIDNKQITSEKFIR